MGFVKIELLKTFLEVARTLHFRIASETLFITQSAVSARIKLLEDELGVLLFDRSQKQLKITPEGHRLIKHANELIFMWQKTKQDVGMVQNDSLQKLCKTSIMTIIPVYNVGGALNRNSHTRANQNGPTTYGFRGNARNFDLNQD